MPSSSDSRIEELCSRIKVLCREPFSRSSEAELRRLARLLRVAISQHVATAKSSLSAKKAAIVRRDPGDK
ncbi:MAG: hypothetical protein WA899_13525 [Candidatus Sulfotelmatobacter sp.]